MQQVPRLLVCDRFTSDVVMFHRCSTKPTRSGKVSVDLNNSGLHHTYAISVPLRKLVTPVRSAASGDRMRVYPSMAMGEETWK